MEFVEEDADTYKPGSTLGTKRHDDLALQQRQSLVCGPNKQLRENKQNPLKVSWFDVRTIDKPPGLARLRCERGDGGEGTASTSKTSSN